jgi:hypothetical protein
MPGVTLCSTLVGIAGEDDLDAPDLTDSHPEAGKPGINSKSDGNGGQQNGSGRVAPRANAKKSASVSLQSELSGALSASLKGELLREIEGLSTADDAALWAQRHLVAKNQLSAADAQHVEEAFAAKLAMLPEQGAQTGDAPMTPSDQSMADEIGTPLIDKSVLVFPEPRRLRDREHIRHVMKQPCLICGRRPSDPHHLRFAQCRALGRKASDQFTVPLCRGHHREVHRHGDEAGWWRKVNVDPLMAARSLWLQTHPLHAIAAAEGVQSTALPPLEGH